MPQSLWELVVAADFVPLYASSEEKLEEASASVLIARPLQPIGSYNSFQYRYVFLCFCLSHHCLSD